MSIWSLEAGGLDYDAAQGMRKAAFAKIEPKGNWKNPINAWIDASDYAECQQAAVFFTGGGLFVVERSGDRLHVTGHGYYANVGA